MTKQTFIVKKITFCNKMIVLCLFDDWVLRVKLSFGVKSDPVELRDAFKRNVGSDGATVIAEWDGKPLPPATGRLRRDGTMSELIRARK